MALLVRPVLFFSEAASMVYDNWFTQYNEVIRELQTENPAVTGSTAQAINPADPSQVYDVSFWHTALDSWASTITQWRQTMINRGITNIPAVPVNVMSSAVDVQLRWAECVRYADTLQGVWYAAAQQDFVVSPTTAPSSTTGDSAYLEDLYLRLQTNHPRLNSDWQNPQTHPPTTTPTTQPTTDPPTTTNMLME